MGSRGELLLCAFSEMCSCYLLSVGSLSCSVTYDFFVSSSSILNVAHSACFKTVAKLQVRVQELQHERKIGSTRDMDAVEEDIRSVQAQITQIRRQHLNNFYYF